MQSTHPIVNTEQAEAWNGYEGGHWAEHDERWNAVNGGFDDPLLEAAAIGPHAHVLDIGCGAGKTSRLAARLAPRGRVLGVDLSGPMLARAGELAAEQALENLEFIQADAQVHPFPAGRFDVAISRFSAMFFGDPLAAFGNIRRALRPGGRLALVCMGAPGRNEWLAALEALRGLVPLPPAPAPGDPGMFSLADPAGVERLLTGAGYREVAVAAVEAPMHWGRDAPDAAAFLLGSGPGRHLLAQADPATADRVRRALTAALLPAESADGLRLRGSALLVTATA